MSDMLPLLVFCSFVLLGVFLVHFGVRGRRINDHPVCRRCRFDLHGVYPGTVTCPECGSGLKGKRALRTGVRVARRGPIILGSMMLGVAVLLVAAVVWLMAAGPSMNKHKPALVLALEGRYAGTKASREAAKEFIRRLGASELSANDAGWGLRTALGVQANLKRPWVAEWGNFVEDARASGFVDDGAFARYLKQGVVLDCRVRPGVVLGDRAPLVVGVAEWRRASAPSFELGVWIDGIRIGGRPVEWIYHGDRRLALSNSESPLRITGSRKSWRGGGKQRNPDSVGIEIDLPESIAPGDHEMEIDIRVSGEAGAKAESRDASVARLSSVLRRPIRLTGARVQNGTPRSDADKLRQYLASATVELSVVTWGGDEGEPACRALVTAPRSVAPTPFCFTVFVRIDGKEYHAGRVTSGQLPRRQRLGVAPGGALSDPEPEVLLIADIPSDEIPGADVTRCDLIFRPDPAMLPLTLDMTECWESEVVIEDVAMPRQRIEPEQ